MICRLAHFVVIAPGATKDRSELLGRLTESCERDQKRQVSTASNSELTTAVADEAAFLASEDTD